MNSSDQVSAYILLKEKKRKEKNKSGLLWSGADN